MRNPRRFPGPRSTHVHHVALIATLVAAACGGKDATDPVTDDPRTEACQRGTLADGQTRNSSLGSGDCRSASENVFAEVWKVSVPASRIAIIDVTSEFDAVITVFDAQGEPVSVFDDGFAGDAEQALLDAPGEYLVVVSTFEPAEDGASINLRIATAGLQREYNGTINEFDNQQNVVSTIRISFSTPSSTGQVQGVVTVTGNGPTRGFNFTGTIVDNFRVDIAAAPPFPSTCPTFSQQGGIFYLDRGGLHVVGQLFGPTTCLNAVNGSVDVASGT